MNASLWKVTPNEAKPGFGYVTDDGSNTRGGELPLAAAQAIVDSHNRDRNPEVIEEFRQAAYTFLQDQFSAILDNGDPETSHNYWYILRMMGDGLTEQLVSLTNPNNNFMRLKAN